MVLFLNQFYLPEFGDLAKAKILNRSVNKFAEIKVS